MKIFFWSLGALNRDVRVDSFCSVFLLKVVSAVSVEGFGSLRRVQWPCVGRVDPRKG